MPKGNFDYVLPHEVLDEGEGLEVVDDHDGVEEPDDVGADIGHGLKIIFILRFVNLALWGSILMFSS